MYSAMSISAALQGHAVSALGDGGRTDLPRWWAEGGLAEDLPWPTARFAGAAVTIRFVVVAPTKPVAVTVDVSVPGAAMSPSLPTLRCGAFQVVPSPDRMFPLPNALTPSI